MKTTVNNATPDFQTIEQEISSIFRALAASVEEQIAVVRERPVKGSSCKGIITLYSRDDARRREADRHFEPAPIARYAFYPSTLEPTRLGSVAIYGDNAGALCATLQRQAILFGHRIISARLESGRRPFVDVKLRA